MLGLKIQSWTGLFGTLCSDSSTTKVHPYTTLSSVLCAYGFGTAGVALNIFVLEWNWNLNVYLGFGCGLLALWLWSKIHPLEHNG